MPESADPLSRGAVIWTSPLPVPPDAGLVDRFGAYPRDFHAAAESAGFLVRAGDTIIRLKTAIDEAGRNNTPVLLFVYSLRLHEGVALALFGHEAPAVVYYQHVDPSRLSWPKRVFVYWLLDRARLILVQDALRLERFRSMPCVKRSVFFPWVVDDAFFTPAANTPPRAGFLFVPGDRGRLDDMVVEIARRTGRRIVRVSRFFTEAALAAYQECPSVEVRYFVRWPELLRLYEEADVVLNVVDDRETSAGMTTFLEALAMNTLVVTPSAHSCAGYTFSDGERPYLTVKDPRNVDEWVRAIDTAAAHPRRWPAGRAPRDLFVRFSGMKAAGARWRSIFSHATEHPGVVV